MYIIYNFETKKIVVHFDTLKDAREFAKNNGWTNKNILKFGR